MSGARHCQTFILRERSIADGLAVLRRRRQSQLTNSKLEEVTVASISEMNLTRQGTQINSINNQPSMASPTPSLLINSSLTDLFHTLNLVYIYHLVLSHFQCLYCLTYIKYINIITNTISFGVRLKDSTFSRKRP